MRLISAYIENFGTLSNQSFEFNKNLTSLLRQNGFGKSTLAAFIKAMFYSLPSDTASKKFNDRRHYYPFNSGKFGGNLIFEMGGDTYKIERFFDKKSEVRDSLTVYKNGSLFDGFEGNIGQSVFSVDEETFEKTLFIDSNDIDSFKTAGISKSLGEFLENDGVGFEKASEILENKIKALKAIRGKGGEINRLNDELFSLNSRLENLKTISFELSQKYSERAGLTDKISALEKEERTLQKQELIRLKKQNYDELLSELSKNDSAKNTLCEKYPQSIPSEQEIALFQSLIKNKSAADAALSSSEFSEKNKERLKALSERFKSGIDDDTLNIYEQKLSLFCSLKESPIEVSQNYTKLESTFKGKLPDENTLKLLEQNVNMMLGTKKGADKKVPIFLFVVFGALSLLSGLGALFLASAFKIPLIILSTVFFVIFVIFAVLSFKRTSSSGDELAKSVKSFLANYGYGEDGSLTLAYSSFLADLKLYRELYGEYQIKIKEENDKRAKKEALFNEISLFLKGYGYFGQDILSEFKELQEDLILYKTLLNQKSEKESNSASLLNEIKTLDQKISLFLEKYALKSQNLFELSNELIRDFEYLKTLEKKEAELKVKINDFESKNQAELSEDVKSTLSKEQVELSLSEYRQNLSLLDKLISDDERSLEAMNETEALIELKAEQIAALTEEHKLLSLTLKHLKTAEENLIKRYLSPVEKAFLENLFKISDSLDDKFFVDKDLSIFYEQHGENRSEMHLSMGQKSVVSLCMRLSLISVVFENDKPFIIMDDPFISLDKEHMKKVSEIISRLSCDMQIIYLCCHESREIK